MLWSAARAFRRQQFVVSAVESAVALSFNWVPHTDGSAWSRRGDFETFYDLCHSDGLRADPFCCLLRCAVCVNIHNIQFDTFCVINP